jgi:hypothetical protein
MVGDQHGPYWALFSKGGKLIGQLIERPGPHFIGNAENARQRIARVMVVEVSPDHDEVGSALDRSVTAQDEEAEHGK